MNDLDATVLVGDALDVLLALERVEPVDGGFVRDDLTASLHFPDEGGLAVLADIALDELKEFLLLVCQGELRQVQAL